MNELDDLKEIFKKNLEEIISVGNIEEAENMITEYESIFKEDIEVYSFKGVIELMKGNIDEAEKIFTEGLELQPFNFDILYNLAYLYKSQKKYIIAYRFYQKALKVASKNDILDIVGNEIKQLSEIDYVREYMQRKKVLFIAYIFPPVGGSGVQRSLKFVKYLRNFGWEPIVVTVGESGYPLKDETMLSEIPEEIEIIRIAEKKEVDIKYANKLVGIYAEIVNDNNIIEEYVNELNKSEEHLNQLLLMPDTCVSWATEVLDKIGDKVDFKDIDVVYTTSGPYSDHIIGYYLKQRYNKPWVVDFRDEWTNNPYANFDKNSIIYKINFNMENNIIQKADKIISVTPLSKENYEEIFNLESSKVHQITNGYDEDDFIDISKNKNKNEKFTIMHNGMLYMIRTPITFMKAIHNIIERGKIEKTKIKVIFGFTDNLEEFIEIRDQLGLKDVVEFVGYMTHNESLKLANLSDLLLLIVGSGEKNKGVFTGKIFEYLRLCKPIISLSPKDSVVEELINYTNRGRNVDFYDIDKIEEYILEMYRAWEKDFDFEFKVTENILKFERRNLTKELTEIFIEISNDYKSREINNIKLNNDKDFKEKNSGFYDSIFSSGGWNQTYFKHYTEIIYYEMWIKALELIKKVDNPNIIEIGCGPGQFANLLFDNAIKNYKGIDFSKEAIKYARIRNEKNECLFTVDNAYTTDVFNENYNTVVIFEVLEHVDEDLKILKRIRNGSNILFSVPSFYSDGHVRWFDSKQEIINRYKEHIDIQDIFDFSIEGMNKIFLIYGKVKS